MRPRRECASACACERVSVGVSFSYVRTRGTPAGGAYLLHVTEVKHGMAKPSLSCGRDLTCVSDLKVAVEAAGQDG